MKRTNRIWLVLLVPFMFGVGVGFAQNDPQGIGGSTGASGAAASNYPNPAPPITGTPNSAPSRPGQAINSPDQGTIENNPDTSSAPGQTEVQPGQNSITGMSNPGKVTFEGQGSGRNGAGNINSRSRNPGGVTGH